MSDFTFPKLPLLSFPLHLQTWISGSVSYLCQQQFHFSGYCVPRHWGYPQLLLTTHIQIPFGIYFFPNISVVTLLFMTCSAAAVVHVPSRSRMNYCNFRVHVSCFQFCPLESVCPGSSSAEEVTSLAPSSAHSLTSSLPACASTMLASLLLPGHTRHVLPQDLCTGGFSFWEEDSSFRCLHDLLPTSFQSLLGFHCIRESFLG